MSVQSVKVPSLKGPSFIAFIVDDLEAASAFWTGVVGLKPADESPPHVQVYKTHPIPFAIRLPLPGESHKSGNGVAAWFSVRGDIDDYHSSLKERGAEVGKVLDGPFGRMFTLVAPGGFTVTVHVEAP